MIGPAELSSLSSEERMAILERMTPEELAQLDAAIEATRARFLATYTGPVVPLRARDEDPPDMDIADD